MSCTTDQSSRLAPAHLRVAGLWVMAAAAATLLACASDELGRHAPLPVDAIASGAGAFCVLGDGCDRHDPVAQIDSGSELDGPVLTSADLPPLAGDVETATFAVG